MNLHIETDPKSNWVPAFDNCQALTLPLYIEVEIGTYCNRRCQWCPNSNSQRGRQRTRIEHAAWRSILEDLHNADYQGQFAFHNFNEPLADPQLLKYVESARLLLPQATLIVYSNGDFLTPDLLQNLEVARLNELRITLYPNSVDSVDEELSGHERIARYLAQQGFTASDRMDQSPFGGVAVHRSEHGSLSIMVRVPELGAFNNRAGTLGPPSIRTSSCYLPLQAAAVDVHGNLKLCCHIYDSFSPDTASCVIGNVMKASLLSLWGSLLMNRRRHQLAAADFSELPPCQTCDHKPSPLLKEFLVKLHKGGER